MLEIDLGKNKYPSQSALIKKLAEMDYVRQLLVVSRGEFSVRGDIVDVFAQNHTHPVRLEYFGDELEDMRTFDVHTQRSISRIASTRFVPADPDSVLFSRLPDSGGVSLNIATELSVGDYVVHEHHGVGVFKGLLHMSAGGLEGEYLFLQYRGEDKLYVPLEQVNVIHKYGAGGVVPQVHSLNDNAWNKTRSKAKHATQELARDLLQLYKIRHNKPGFSFSPDTVYQIELETRFPFKETRDQTKAVSDVKQDMESSRPMDRLVCGDVGFGKTEVALRAAFKASLDNKQVAILVPTTVLAEQHYRNFSVRLQGFGLRVEVISRFKTRLKQKDILKKVKDGKIDVIIGTHRLLQKDVEFKDLGLLIVDEEQRFGVGHKEKIKQLRKIVDVLTMTATPIPRTLYMSLSGIRDMSVINTPPEGREPVATIVLPYDENIIKAAILKEAERGGQVFIVNNNIQALPHMAAAIRKLLPDIRIVIGHGQMKAHALEKAMLDFLDKKYDVLLCSTIIEAGLDIPNVNTIIIIDADKFGLAQLHQLRGRVGRALRNAYAYLLYDSARAQSKDAIERLKAIAKYTALGSGFDIAVKDLQIRGAGNILGPQQHGNMLSVGFELYCKLLEESISEAKGEKQEKPIELNMGNLYIPDEYIDDYKQKLAVYKRLLSARNSEEIDEIYFELKDRYGGPPKEIDNIVDNIKGQLTDNY